MALGAVAPVFAQQSAKAVDDRELHARELFATGRYAEALEIYGRLYAETMHPTYMRNIARCFQNLGEPDKAILSFREYLRQSADLTPEQRAQVEGYIAEMEALKRQRDAAAAPREPAKPAAPAVAPAPPAASSPAPPASPPPAPAPALVEIKAAPTVPLVVSAAPDVSEDHAATTAKASPARAITGLAIAGAGGVAVAVGTLFGLRARSDNNQALSLCGGSSGACKSAGEKQAHDGFVRSATSERTAAIVGFGVGAAALATGIWLFATAQPAHEPPARVALWSDGRAGAGLVATGRW